MIGWNFPSNGGGLIRGVAEAGIQTFTGKEISSLAREVCQNSLDAVADEKSAVTVEFQCHKIFSRNIPGYNNYKTVLSKCREFELWIGNKKTQNFLDRASEKINLLETLVLRISDYNTTGLAEPYNPLARDGWNALTKIDGGATKTGDAAGSFGIGKNAPFANFFYRLVFYRTLNQKDERAAQGMARLVSFQLNPDDISAGIGYYGETQKNMPVEKIDELENLSQRNKSGTDIFIYGFNGGANWLDEIICELLKNFLVAIHRGKLSVNLSKLSVDKNNLAELLNKYGDEVQNAVNYYKILSGNEAVKFFEKDFHGMGKLKLGVLMDSKIKLNRKVLVVRKNGMKIFEQDRISRLMSFTGILELEGLELNAFFREMETPSHDKWEPSRYEKNPKLAKDYLKELKRWVRETILSLNEESISDEINVEGLSHMLDFDDGTSTGGSKEVETIDNPSAPENSPQELPKDKAINKPQVNSEPQPGDQTDKKGDPPAIRTGSGTRKRKTATNHTGKKNPRGVNIVFEPIDCDKIRVTKIGDKKYKLILKVSRDIFDGKLEISAVGENNSGEKLFITAATCADSSVEVRAKGDKINFKNLRAGVETKITFELRDAGNYALGIAIYEGRAHMIKIDDKKYKLILKVPRDIPEGRIEISPVGKNSDEKLFITAATCADSSVEVRITDNKINFKNLRANVETKITFELRDAENYALGVAVYENQC